jgi:hypothetical protein
LQQQARSARNAASGVESTPGPSGVRRLRPIPDRGADSRQHLVTIGIALAVEKLLVGAECRHPALDFLAKFGPGRRRRPRRRHDLSYDLISMGRVAFSIWSTGANSILVSVRASGFLPVID